MFSKFFDRIGLTSKMTRHELEEFVKKYKDSGLTLDLGCGTAPYKRYFPNRVSFDARPGPEVDIVGDAHNLPFPDGKFDNILCTEVLEHLHSPEVAISEMKRVLKTGGKLILTTRFVFPLHDVPEDYYRYTKYGLEYLFRDWQIVELREELSTGETIAALLQRIMYQSDIRGGKLSKLVIFALIKIVTPFLSFLIKREYGRAFPRRFEEKSIMTSGYYLVCEKVGGT